jgi:DNA-binding response OmpR family regulator
VASILLLDDDEGVLDVLGKGLRKAGHDVFMATDGSAGLRIASDNSVDVLVTDIIMPGMEGLETIGAIRGLHPAIRVIAMSGGGAIGPRNYLDLARALGADTTLQKPFTLGDLVSAVGELTGEGN